MPFCRQETRAILFNFAELPHNIYVKSLGQPCITMDHEEEEEVFEVYKILARRKTRKGTLEYLVRWKNYGEEDDTWEPIENLQDCDEVLQDFNERLSKGEAMHIEQTPKRGRFHRLADSPSRDSNASSRGSTPPRTRNMHNGPEKHKPHDSQSRDERRSPKLASYVNSLNSMSKKRSPNYLKPPRQKWEFFSISPQLPVGVEKEKRHHESPHVKQLFNDNNTKEDEDIFSSQSRDNDYQDSYSSLSNGNSYDSDVYIPAKRMKKSHSVIGTPLQTMDVANGGMVIVTGRERFVSASGIHVADGDSGDQSPIELLAKFSPVVKLKSITPTKRLDEMFIHPDSEPKKFADKRKASVIARRRLSQTEAGPPETEGKVDRRKSVRQIENLYKYKEIVVKKCKGYTQIRLFTTTPLRNALNIKALKELTGALNSAAKDDSKVVFLSGSGSMFCSGLDLQCLRKHSIEERRKASKHLASTLRTFVDTLINFPKVVVVAVNGPAVGIGAAILPLCDIVYASDKAWFHFPYASLGQTPEGCSSLTIPEVMGIARAGEMLYAGRKLTALEACSSGLVSHVFWPTSLMQEVTPRVQKIATGSAKMLSTSKMLIRSQLKPKLEYVNERECSALEEAWVSPEFYRQAKAFLDKGIADL